VALLIVGSGSDVIVVPLRFVFDICVEPVGGSGPVFVLVAGFVKQTWIELPYGACTGYTVDEPTLRLLGDAGTAARATGGVHESSVATV
jgi:hypothetical protein